MVAVPEIGALMTASAVKRFRIACRSFLLTASRYFSHNSMMFMQRTTPSRVLWVRHRGTLGEQNSTSFQPHTARQAAPSGFESDREVKAKVLVDQARFGGHPISMG